MPPCPDLPLNADPATLGTPSFERRHTALDAESWAALRRHAAREQLTPSSLLLAAYAEVLAQWSRSPHFTLNLTLFNRTLPGADFDGVLGDFTTLLLVEADLRAAASFGDRARALQRQVWSDLDHALISGVEVLDRLAERRRTPTGRAVMPVVFTSAIGAGSYLDAASAFGAITEAGNQTPQVWLDYQAVESGDGVQLIWDSVAGLFPDGLLDAMFDAHRRLLADLTREETWRRPTPALLPAAAAERIAEANASAPPLPGARPQTALLHGPFLAMAARPPQCRGGRRGGPQPDLRRAGPSQQPAGAPPADARRRL